MVEPLALQDNLGKTPAAEKITQIEKAQPELAQRDTVLVTRKKALEHQSKPVPPERTDEVIIHRNQEQKKEREEQPRREKKPPGAEEHASPEAGAPEEPSVKHLDVQA